MNGNYLNRLLILAIVLVGINSSLALAQVTTGVLYGTVKDETGAVLPGAEVTALNVLTQYRRGVTTDDRGDYLIPGLPVGTYQVSAELPGFRRSVISNINLSVNQNIAVDVSLRVGEVMETVEVSAAATGIEIRSSTIGETMDRVRLEELPLVSRNILELAQTMPGVTRASVPTTQLTTRGGAGLVVAGGRDTENEFRFDSVPHINLVHNTPLSFPNPDAIQEFKILTGNYSAEYGRGGGGVFIAVTKAGTNEFHGSAFNYLRNKALNARNFFASDKPDLKQNQFGGSLGGPIIHNKTFFFASYQGVRIRESQLLASAFPPTPLERSGDFSQSGRKPLDPTTGQPFGNDKIPENRFDPVAVRILNEFVPLSNSADGRFVHLNPRNTDNNQITWRIDHEFSSSNSINFRHFRDSSGRENQSGNIAPYAPFFTSFVSHNLSLAHTYAFSPAWMNQLQLGYSRGDQQEVTPDRRSLNDFGGILPGATTMPRINVTGYFNLSRSSDFRERPNIYQVSDTVNATLGRHQLTFGGEFLRTDIINRADTRQKGYFTFDNSIANNAFAAFLLGKPTLLVQASPYERVVKGSNWYAFIQDNVRMSQRITINLGLRYSYFQPYRHDRNWMNTFIEGFQSNVPGAPPGMAFISDGISERLVEGDKNNFAPRLGLAWDLFGDQTTSFRAGYGLFYQDLRSDIWTYPAVNQPFVMRLDTFAPESFQDPYGGASPFPYYFQGDNGRFSFPMGLFDWVSPDLRPPHSHHFSVSLERVMPGDMFIRVGYLGKEGRNQLRMVQKNPAEYIPGESTIANTNDRRILYPGYYGSIRQIATVGWNNYHSLQVTVKRQSTDGLVYSLSYTLGKMLDEYSSQNLGQLPQDPIHPEYDRGRSDEDRRHSLSASFLYGLPELLDRAGLIRSVFGGWAISGLVNLRSGRPILITAGQDFSLTGVGFDRPNLIGNPEISASRNRGEMIQEFFNTAAFEANRPGEYGNLGRNVISGPAFSKTDIAISKSFVMPYSENHRLQLRGELFNVFNQVNFGQPSGNFSSSQFGRITSASDPRIAQIALRYTF